MVFGGPLIHGLKAYFTFIADYWSIKAALKLHLSHNDDLSSKLRDVEMSNYIPWLCQAPTMYQMN